MKSKKEKEKAKKKIAKSLKDGKATPKPDGFDYGGISERDLKKNLGCG